MTGPYSRFGLGVHKILYYVAVIYYFWGDQDITNVWPNRGFYSIFNGNRYKKLHTVLVKI